MGDLVLIDESYLEDIADAIRDRNRTTETYKPYEMDEAIKDLHNSLVKKWIRPSEFPDYSTIDISNDEVIYLTYDLSYENMCISVRVYGDYIIQKGNIENGAFVPSGEAVNMASGTVFTEELVQSKGNYIVYQIKPQEGSSLTRFEFARRNSDVSSIYISGWQQPCVERFARIPNWIGCGNRTATQYVWSTRYLVADTIMDATPSSLANAYNDGGYTLEYCDMGTCSFKNVTSLASMFYNHYRLSELYLPHDLSSKCTNLSNVFYNVFALNYVDVTGWDTSKVTTFVNMFNGCRDIIEIIGIEDFDISSTTTLQGMFSGCYELQELNLSKWESTDKLTSLNGTFNNCQSIKELDVSGFITDNVTTFVNCFSSVQNVKELDLSNWKVTNKCTSLANMFSYCRLLRNIIRNYDWDTSNVTTFESMFRECREMREIDIHDFVTTKATTVRYMFQQSNCLQKLDASTMDFIKITNKTNVTDFATNCWLLSEFVCPENSTYMPGINYAYNLKSLYIPATTTTITDNSLRNLEQLEILDLTAFEAIPTLNAATDISNGINSDLKIVVPDELYETWIDTGNWANANIRPHIISEANLSLLNNINLLDSYTLPTISWVKNSAITTDAAVGTSYSTMNTNGSGNRIESGLIDVSSISGNFIVSVDNDNGYGVLVRAFDEDGLYLRRWTSWTYKHPVMMYNPDNAVKKISIAIIYNAGSTALLPEDWENAGLEIKYQMPNQ